MNERDILSRELNEGDNTPPGPGNDKGNKRINYTELQNSKAKISEQQVGVGSGMEKGKMFSLELRLPGSRNSICEGSEER